MPQEREYPGRVRSTDLTNPDFIRARAMTAPDASPGVKKEPSDRYLFGFGVARGV